MASSDSGSIPANPSFEVREEANKFTKSISTREPSFSEHHDFVPPRLSSATISHSLPAPTSPAKPNHFLTSHQCLASVLKKDGQILSIAVASNGFVYTGSESNVIRVWNLPDFTECDQLKSRARKVVAIVVSNDKLYAAYADRKIRVWCRASDRVAKHVRLATFPRSAGSLFRSYISGGDTMGRHLGPISSLAISISDDVLYSASLDKTVKVWRFPDFKCIETIAAHSGPINAIIATEDGELYTASDDATVRVWRRNYSVTYRPHALTITLSSKSSPVKTLTLSSDTMKTV